MRIIKVTTIFLTGVLMLVAVYCNSAQAGFTVKWDPNDPTPDGYRLFARWEGTDTYDYTKPFWEGQEVTVRVDDLLPPLPEMIAPTNTSATWDKASSSVTVDWNQPPQTVVTDKVYMVVRAYLDPIFPNTETLESEDSEEVNIDQSNQNVVTEWEVWFAETSGGPYTSLGKVPATGNTRITEPLTVVPVGQAKTIYFTVVAFGQNGVHSPDSQETSVIVDRRILEPPANISVTVTVPVQ